MGLLDRFRPRRSAGGGRSGEAESHLREWAGARIGVEAFVEPRTTVTETTVVFVAHDGEWTRRRVGNPARARKLARSMKMPIYDVQLVGYPNRMREHDARERALRKRARQDEMLRQLRDKDREDR
ncbi:oxidoreductase [Pseudonocardia sp. HH130630-07]|uniref:oxidoreductase n=1 Tax=Pseudonocardia sp. HH130630-07 TaxID=1690815 RepID=UPI000814FABB|nr:oxidoreductase [Pseudonocardia sp. HH130630-07]ANY05195.1 oxidoreductase [Pseudonocardia sp. HH130630-07]